ncbi:MAG: sigma-70 family RNA polymerase sigma factor [Planctomycetes bacterium]|nr:sigma-70 family RNA polymerase sigma factor [Planctomycetota bacterium]
MESTPSPRSTQVPDLLGFGVGVGGECIQPRTHSPGARPIQGQAVPEPAVTPDADDFTIVERVLRGDRDAFALLVSRYERLVYRLALRLSAGDVERAKDLFQETFLRAYRGLAGFQRGSQFSTWLHRVTVNCSISQHRKDRALKRGRALSLDAPVGEDEESKTQVAARGLDPAGESLDAEGRRRIQDVIGSLEPDLRALVVTVLLEGRSYEEASQMLDVPIGTVRSRLHRARELMLDRLKSAMGR